jgi:NADH-quinone oxidoreductase subunit L
MSNLVWLIPLAPLIATVVGFGLCLANRQSASRTEIAHLPTWIGLAIAAGICLMTLLSTTVGEGEVRIAAGYNWLSIGKVQIPIEIRLDSIGLVQLTVVTCISLLVAIYARGYMHGDPGYARFFAIISGFVFAMVMLVLASNLLVLYAFWEGVGLCSYLLIGYWYQKPSAANAATKAFLVNRLADTAFLAGILLLWYGVGQTTSPEANGTLARLNFDVIFSSLTQLAEKQPTLMLWVGFLLLIGAIGKSAQFPFHVWLPDAMEGPTPVSALIHAATMVTAGVYLLARMSPLLAYTPEVLQVAGWLGAITALLGGTIALFQDDLKRVLAYSTVSQLGLLFMAFGVGVYGDVLPYAVIAAMFHLLTHAFFKALLFLTAGNVMHAMGDVIDMRQFSGLRGILPKSHWLFLIGGLALAGAPPLAGFWSKESILGILAANTQDGQRGTLFTTWLVMGLASALLTGIYTSRAYFRTFWGPVRTPSEAGDHPHEATPVMLAPLYVLALGSLLVGAVVHFSGALDSYLLPMNQLEHAAKAPHAGGWLALASIAIVVIGCWVGYFWTKQSSSDARPATGLLAVAANRFYLDELFGFIIVAPLQMLANFVGYFDTQVVDGFLRKFSAVPQVLGGRLRKLQTGVISSYAVSMVLGIILLVTLVFFQL